jgi:hypothetical protein
LGQLLDLSGSELVERGLSHPEGCEVDFAHGGGGEGGVGRRADVVALDGRWSIEWSIE